MDNFENRITMPENWFKQSFQMLEASKSLYDVFEQSEVQNEKDNFRQVGVFKGVMLLLGLAVENALKGARVCQEIPELETGKLKSKHFHDKPHDLKNIADKLSLTLSQSQYDLLERLTVFVRWGAKYQAPLSKIDYQAEHSKLKTNTSDFNLSEVLILDLLKKSGFHEKDGW